MPRARGAGSAAFRRHWNEMADAARGHWCDRAACARRPQTDLEPPFPAVARLCGVFVGDDFLGDVRQVSSARGVEDPHRGVFLPARCHARALRRRVYAARDGCDRGDFRALCVFERGGSEHGHYKAAVGKAARDRHGEDRVQWHTPLRYFRQFQHRGVCVRGRGPALDRARVWRGEKMAACSFYRYAVGQRVRIPAGVQHGCDRLLHRGGCSISDFCGKGTQRGPAADAGRGCADAGVRIYCLCAV